MRERRGTAGEPAQWKRWRPAASPSDDPTLFVPRVASDPDAAVASGYWPSGAPSTSLAAVPPSREFVGVDGTRLTLSRDSTGAPVIAWRRASPVTLTYWPAANPTEVHLAARLVERWNSEHPDVQVHVQPLPAG